MIEWGASELQRINVAIAEAEGRQAQGVLRLSSLRYGHIFTPVS